MKKEYLIEEFGKDVAIKARDYTISNIERLLSKKSKGIANMSFDLIRDLPPDKLEAVKHLLIHYVDGAIHDLFAKFNESCGKYKIVTKDESGNDLDIVAESDGLNYEYLGLIDEFSKYNSAEVFLETGKLEKDKEG